MSEMVAASKRDVVIDVKDLFVSFKHPLGYVRAVNGVSLNIKKGEILGVVGESGCGKSVTAMTLLKLIPMPPGQIDEGSIMLRRAGNEVVNIADLPPKGRLIRDIRGKDVSIIFQEPMRSLHPMFNVGHQIVEGLLQHNRISKRDAQGQAIEILSKVGLPNPKGVMKNYPFELSGGMRQRAMIAIAIACSPQLLIADEPTTALDVTIQAQVLELIKELQESTGLAVMLITHDMGVIAETADRVMVMYLGKVVEHSNVRDLFENPSHPYTQNLLKSIPSLVGEPKVHLKTVQGTVPELFQVPQGCVFADRCEQAHEKCVEEPPTIELKSGHSVKCWLYEKE